MSVRKCKKEKGWFVRWREGPPDNRQQRYRSFPTKREAQDWDRRVHGKDYVAQTKMTVGEFLDDWLTTAAGGADPQPTTLRIYRRAVRALTERLGGVRLGALNLLTIHGAFAKAQADGAGKGAIRSQLKVLRAALGYAVESGLIGRNPTATKALRTLARAEQRKRPVWDVEEVRLFLGRARQEQSPYYPLYLTALATGMRQGELLGLRWEDVNLDYGLASVRQAFYRFSGSKREGTAVQLLFRPPKTKGSARTVSLPESVVQAMREIRATQQKQREMLGAEYVDYGLVFCQPTGKPLHPHNIATRDFRPLMERAGVPRLRFHDLRHAHVSYLALAGVPVKVAQERVGHVTSKMTLDVYTHTFAGQDADAARKVEALLLGTDRAVQLCATNGPDSGTGPSPALDNQGESSS